MFTPKDIIPKAIDAELLRIRNNLERATFQVAKPSPLIEFAVACALRDTGFTVETDPDRPDRWNISF